ncbi:MAG: beta-carotene 15,15'-monooxygenase, partial [Peptostreptococcus porci]|nr:beta-carotene 15,15'-monooxygenase [Peptostreptococcus porci]
MGVFESIFDIAYLLIVISLGIKLLNNKKSGGRLFGIMAILLGAGDAFHLVPRIISHFTANGF